MGMRTLCATLLSPSATPNAATNVDVITDFTPGTDKIVLNHLIFTDLVAGNLPAGQLVTGNGAFSTQADDFLVYDSGGGNLFYDAGGAGGAAPVWIAHLDNNPTLTAADFSVA